MVENVIDSFGAKTFRFLLLFMIIHSGLVALFISNGYEIPRPLDGQLIRISNIIKYKEELKQQAEAGVSSPENVAFFFTMINIIVGVLVVIISDVLLGFINMTTALSSIIPNAFISTSIITFSVILQVSVWYYVIRRLWELIVSLLPVIERLIAGLSSAIPRFIGWLLGG